MAGRRPETIARLRERNARIIEINRSRPELTLAQIGALVGLSESMVSIIMARHRQTAPTPARLAKRDAALLDARLRMPPPSLAALAEEFGLSVSSVGRALKRAEKARSLPRKRVRGLHLPEPVVAAPAPFQPDFHAIDRSPCPRCGARGDIGCSHRSAS